MTTDTDWIQNNSSLQHMNKYNTVTIITNFNSKPLKLLTAWKYAGIATRQINGIRTFTEN